MKITHRSPNPASAWSMSSTPVAATESATPSATPSATISTAILFVANSTTSTPRIANTIAMSDIEPQRSGEPSPAGCRPVDRCSPPSDHFPHHPSRTGSLTQTVAPLRRPNRGGPQFGDVEMSCPDRDRDSRFTQLSRCSPVSTPGPETKLAAAAEAYLAAVGTIDEFLEATADPVADAAGLEKQTA